MLLNAANSTPSGTGPRRHLWNVADFQRIGRTLFLHTKARLELIEGEIFDMAPIGSFHAGTVTLLANVFMQAVARRAIVQTQSPIVLSDHSEPEPDLTLLRPRADYYLHAHPGPGDVLLLIEVSDSTINFDRKTKVPLYARHGIPEVWLVVGPKRRRVEVFRDLDAAQGVYRTTFQLREGVLAPVLLPQAEIRLSDVFL
jgi:Uma2 family endonuclease